VEEVSVIEEVDALFSLNPSMKKRGSSIGVVVPLGEEGNRPITSDDAPSVVEDLISGDRASSGSGFDSTMDGRVMIWISSGIGAVALEVPV